MKIYVCLLVFFLSYSALSAESWTNEKWTGHFIHMMLGNVFDFELQKRKGDDLPTQAMFKYGYSYGYQFNNGLFAAAGLDWSIVYPRNFNFKNKQRNFFQPPISLWYLPLSDVQMGYAWSPHWLTTIGLIYYWGMSLSAKYRPVENLFFELNSVIWMDRIFNTGGFYGGGYDNLHLTVGLGFLF